MLTILQTVASFSCPDSKTKSCYFIKDPELFPGNKFHNDHQPKK